MEIQGKILSGKSYKIRTTDNGNQEVKFCIKEGNVFHNFKTYLEKGMDVPPYLKPDQEVIVSTEGAKEEIWDWNGKTYGDLLVHLSMIRKAREMDKTVIQKETLPPVDTFPQDSPLTDWEESFVRYSRLMEVYKPTQAGDLKEIAKMSGFQV